MNRRIKKWFAVCDSPFPKVKLVNNAVQVKNMKNEQIPCLLQGNGFLFLPRAYDTSFKLIASSKQWIKLPKSTCRYEWNLIMKIKFLKNACRCQFHVEMDVIRFARWREDRFHIHFLTCNSHIWFIYINSHLSTY